MKQQEGNGKVPKNLTQKDLLWMIKGDLQTQKEKLNNINFWIRIAIIAALGLNTADILNILPTLTS